MPDKVAVITGSSRGIGAAIAERLAEAGYAVCINCVEQETKARELCEKLTQRGHRAIWRRADVCNEQEVLNMFEDAERELGEVTLVVNNAGIARQQQFQDATDEDWTRILSTNLGGCIHTVRAALPNMLHNKSGCIINISSIWGSHGASCESVYSTSKHAIIGLTRSLAAELSLSGIRVNCVAPGVIDTDMVQVLGQETLDSLAKESIPLARLGTPREIAEAVLYLAQAEYVTGQVLTVDGGFFI